MSAFGASESAHPQSSHSAEGAQQFIMPTVHVPHRRPFTDVGKSLGRLKILIAGKSGTAPVLLCPHFASCADDSPKNRSGKNISNSSYNAFMSAYCSH